jgi:hypothetical protein
MSQDDKWFMKQLLISLVISLFFFSLEAGAYDLYTGDEEVMSANQSGSNYIVNQVIEEESLIAIKQDINNIRTEVNVVKLQIARDLDSFKRGWRY